MKSNWKWAFYVTFYTVAGNCLTWLHFLLAPPSVTVCPHPFSRQGADHLQWASCVWRGGVGQHWTKPLWGTWSGDLLFKTLESHCFPSIISTDVFNVYFYIIQNLYVYNDMEIGWGQFSVFPGKWGVWTPVPPGISMFEWNAGRTSICIHRSFSGLLAKNNMCRVKKIQMRRHASCMGSAAALTVNMGIKIIKNKWFCNVWKAHLSFSFGQD